MNLEMAEANPKKEENPGRSARESAMECTEAITRLPTFYGALQLAHPAQPDEDVKFLP